MILGIDAIQWFYHESIIKSTIRIETSSNMWQDLYHRRFYQRDIFRVTDLQELYKLHSGPLSFTELYTKLHTIWEEIDSFRPVPHCKCVITSSCVSHILFP